MNSRAAVSRITALSIAGIIVAGLFLWYIGRGALLEGAPSSDNPTQNSRAVTSENKVETGGCQAREARSANPGGALIDQAHWYGTVHTLAAKSPVIVTGIVVEHKHEPRTDLPGPPGIVVSGIVEVVQVDEVLKGELESRDGRITIGHVVSRRHPTIPIGCEVVLFLRSIAGSALQHEYVTTGGPQGKFAFQDNGVVPMVPDSRQPLKEYEGLSRERFMAEVRERIQRTSP